MSRNKLYIDGFSFAQPRKSGIGHIAEGLLVALEKEIRLKNLNTRIYIVVAFNKLKYVQKYHSDIISIKALPLPARIFNLLNNLNLVLPLDIFLGRGSYIFPNYRNWPLLFSKSYTYIHDLSFILYPEYTEPKNLSYLKKHIKRWIRRSDTLITASQYTKNEICETFNLKSTFVKVVPHGVTMPDKVRYSEDFIRKTLKKHEVAFEKYILVIGNIEPRKNIINLINAYESLPQQTRNSFGLIIVGGGGWKSQSITERIEHSIAAGYNVFRPKSYVTDDELQAFYARSSLLAMPSFYEGFGLPPLQAMSWGRPTLVANTSSLAELFGNASFLVDPGSVPDICRGLLQALSDTDYRHKDAAYRIVKQYSWSNTARKMLEVLDEKND